ncbi:LLM class flavin-dependent oxidoreductase [Streptomyces sp. NPDC013455]|uniref:LLM class flavin-dependent oxidoreductase n=1 Tax=Streptomyces sp. NPDC013455 TaxID=3155605 RepID=UPI0033E96F2D
MSSLLHLAAAVDPSGGLDAGSPVELARLAERGGLDFVTLDDSHDRSAPDGLGTLCRMASATRRIGLVPTVAATHAEPFRAPAAVAALDRLSRGRAGWRIDALPGPGPWTVPRPPHGHPVRVTDATDGHTRTAAARYADVVLLRAASPAQAAGARDELRELARSFGRRPDALLVLVSLLVDLGDGEYAAEAGHGGGGPRPTVRGPLYRGGPVDLAELMAGWHADGVTDGFHLVPVVPRRDLERLVNGTVALLQHRGLFRTFYPGSTLREHLGLTRPADQYA